MENKNIMEKFKIYNEGITLIALVISIIVLLILATVSINLVINNGILDKAKYAVNKYSEEEELEQIKLAVLSAQMKNNGNLTTDNLNTELQATFNNDETVTEISDYYFYKANKNYRIYKDGKVEEGNLLPDKYQQVEYIESTGTQYIDTGEKWKDDSGIEIDVLCKNGIGNIGYYIFGVWNGNVKDRVSLNTYIYSQTGEFYVETGHDGYVKPNSRQMFLFKNNIFSCGENNQIINNKDIDLNMYIFSLNYINSAHTQRSSMQLYNCKLWSNETLKRNFIPCYSTTTVTDVDGIERPKDTIGLYDTVEEKFYVNKGTGTFIKGNNV